MVPFPPRPSPGPSPTTPKPDRMRGLHVALRRRDDGGIRQRDVESAGSSLATPFGPQTLFTFSEWKIGGAEDSASRDLAGNKHHGLMPTTLASARKRCDSSAGLLGTRLGAWRKRSSAYMVPSWSICNPDFHHAQKAVLYGSTCDSALILTAKIPTAMDRESFEAACHDPQRAPRRCHGDDNLDFPYHPCRASLALAASTREYRLMMIPSTAQPTKLPGRGGPKEQP
ncbi:hypothetical protein V499_07933 [Pseudogymnoascus sp. VKM F-103]|nr:hypothetical protein V499_07933 [Pseudogymnoascus sp. VKM F-103]